MFTFSYLQHFCLLFCCANDNLTVSCFAEIPFLHSFLKNKSRVHSIPLDTKTCLMTLLAINCFPKTPRPKVFRARSTSPEHCNDLVRREENRVRRVRHDDDDNKQTKHEGTNFRAESYLDVDLDVTWGIFGRNWSELSHGKRETESFVSEARDDVSVSNWKEGSWVE